MAKVKHEAHTSLDVNNEVILLGKATAVLTAVQQYHGQLQSIRFELNSVHVLFLK